VHALMMPLREEREKEGERERERGGREGERKRGERERGREREREREGERERQKFSQVSAPVWEKYYFLCKVTRESNFFLKKERRNMCLAHLLDQKVLSLVTLHKMLKKVLSLKECVPGVVILFSLGVCAWCSKEIYWECVPGVVIYKVFFVKTL
jgi:hypothetical protein